MRTTKFVNSKVFLLVCSFLYLLIPRSTVNASSVMLKDWWEYTETDKKRLRERWTPDKVEAILTAIRQKKPLPEFFATQYSDEGILQSRDDLRGISLKGKNLQEASLAHNHLQGADLSGADLQGADFTKANLQGAVLWEAKLQGADLWFAKLQGAVLWEAKLQGADLQGANLQDADLGGTIFDSTYLGGVNLGQAKNIRFILWGDALNTCYVIGEEKYADYRKSRESFRRTEITYRDLKTLYKKELMDDVAMEFHFRENEVITKKYRRTFWKPWDYFVGLFRYIFLKLTYGYGSRPLRLFWYSLSIIGLFGLLFFLMTRFQWKKSGIKLVNTKSDGKEELILLERKRMIRKCFYFSLLSFATFGYGAIKPRQWLQFLLLEPLEYRPVRWARRLVAIEAALGIWIFALLVTVLFGR